MALSDIPEFVTANPGDLITAKNWDNVQKLMRSSLRLHHHTRPAGTPPNDGDTTDQAQQISTAEIADGAVVASKLAAGAVSTASIPDGAITTAKLADLSVGSTKLAGACVTAGKLSFATVNSGSINLGPGLTAEMLVQTGAASTKTSIYFPTVALTSSSGAGISDVTAQIVYRQAVGSTSIDLYIRLVNTGGATVGVIWQVHTFAQ
jgi:hypothetical protein